LAGEGEGPDAAARIAHKSARTFIWDRTDLTAQWLNAQWLNTIGLVLGMGGVVILFIWGPPQPDFDDSVTIGVSFTEDVVFADGTKPSDIAASVRKRRRVHQVMSRVGLSLIGIGFAAQLAAVWS
jgi:hypothetical protein